MYVITCGLCLISGQDNLVGGSGTSGVVLQWLQENRNKTCSTTIPSLYDTFIIPFEMLINYIIILNYVHEIPEGANIGGCQVAVALIIAVYGQG